HLLLDHEGYLPCFAVLTDGQVSDIAVARKLAFQPGSILVIDRSYIDYKCLHRLGEQGVFFVTRMKADMKYKVVRKRQTPRRGPIRRDEEIVIRSVKYGLELRLRRIVLRDEERQETLVFLTNHMGLAGSTIAAVYKDRWQIEIFFKSVKQLLRVKTFVGTSANALKIQMWTALISMLILKFLQWRAKFGWSLSNLVDSRFIQIKNRLPILVANPGSQTAPRVELFPMPAIPYYPRACYFGHESLVTRPVAPIGNRCAGYHPAPHAVCCVSEVMQLRTSLLFCCVRMSARNLTRK
ncbi:MAG: IS4 family transposase, partial [Acidobacteriaceae bacterium]|nr:IS4 family transposase [Acidobacteriaceae bacterium]